MTSEPDDEVVTDRLARAERDFATVADVYDTLSGELSALLAEVRDGKTARASRLKIVAGDLARAAAVLVRERERLDALRAGGPDAGTIGDIDLDAARDEVGRRLARLRATGGGDAVS